MNPNIILQSVFLFLTIGVFTSYAQKPTIAGSITGIGKSPIQFRYVKDGKRQVDTVLAVNDHFKYTPKGSDDSTLTMLFATSGYLRLWVEPGEVTVSGSFDHPFRLRLKGGKENALVDQYNAAIDWKYDELANGKPDSVKSKLEKEKEVKTRAFIQSHPSSRMAAELLYWQSMYNDAELATHETLWQAFTPAVRASKQGIKLSQRLNAVRNQPVPGKSAPDFTIPDVSGNPVSLADFKGKYVLLDFWGHWCGPCVRAFPALKALYDRFANKMTIVGIAAESKNDRDKWVNMIKENNLNWVQLSELEADNGKVNQTYNIVAFPTYFLVDKAGKVVSKSNAIKDIESAINSIEDLK
ncbi:thiol:disulfide interchange protein [Dyadobacter endophyticus]|uniref:Thiol:disulfide interchange protein n=1 Tax=Dyadobacter endophyticus TaxID=1749036 RepID=A0ABQ1YMT3_9BACT|nr:TlpA disulfide reductase family protein [Dyadobacter endophyticus]GGH31919.1 thiol:disulfide interchange protein [Dyadobacter endophyticus]